MLPIATRPREHRAPASGRHASAGISLGIGALAGAFAGLFGVGGGSVMVPLLLLLPGVAERRATAVSLLAIGVMATAGVSAQAVYGHVHVGPGLLVGVPAMVGVLVGAAVQQRIPARAITHGFAGLLAVVGVLTVGGIHAQSAAATSVTATSAAALALIGIAAGAIAGLLGVGGGVLFVPGLSLVCGLDQIEAEATSLLAIVLVAIAGALRQHSYGNLDVRLGALVALGSIPGAVLGVVTVNLLPIRMTEVLFGLLLLLLAAGLALPATRREPESCGREVDDYPCRDGSPTHGVELA